MVKLRVRLLYSNQTEKNDILCAVDIAWHRGDVRIKQLYDFNL